MTAAVVEMQLPEVSIFMPTAKRMGSGLLERAIDSALAQEGVDFELLIVDDGSVDGTQAYLEQLASSDPRIKVVRLERNTGLPAYALAQAYSLARGKYFAWLFDDCELKAGHLRTLRDALVGDSALGLAYGQVTAQLDALHSYVIGSPIDHDSFMRGGNVIPNVCCMVTRDAIEDVGWYDPHVLLKRICDWDLWQRILARYPHRFIPQILAVENGVGLPGSLGHTSSLHMGLALKYSAIDRSGRLSPSELRLGDAFRRDPWALEDDEARTLEIMFLEHALLTDDFGLALDAADHLAELSAQVETDASRRLFNASAALLNDRFSRSAKRLIEFEAAARDALSMADARAELLGEMVSRMDAIEHEKTRLELSLQEAESRASVIPGQEADLGKTLKETQDLLYVFRDAADQRMEMLRVSNARADELTLLAQERLAIIERLTKDLESLQHP